MPNPYKDVIMEIIDITGELYTGMWGYEPPFPRLFIKPLPKVPWVETEVYCEIFEGLHSQSGTYLETPAHLLGDKSYPLINVPVEKLVDIRCYIVKLDCFDIKDENKAITAEMLLQNQTFSKIQKDSAVLVSCHWGMHWRHDRYLKNSPFFTADAMDLIIEKNPFLLGSDFPRWDSAETPQGFFPEFYDADILMLAPVVNLENAPETGSLLTALPLKAEKTSCAPCRAFLRF